jgi:glycerol-3-phosphate cytidylyltransferase-like family protein
MMLLVTTDDDTAKMKGKTLMNELERAEQVYHCRWVDQLIVRSPWVLTQEFLDEYDIDVVVHGDDNSFDENGNDAYAFIKSIGKYTELQRTNGISTTDLITRILKDYNGYIERCMRRGLTYTDLNIPENVWVRDHGGHNRYLWIDLKLTTLSYPLHSQEELKHHIKVDKKYGS